MELTLLANALTAAAAGWVVNRIIRPPLENATDALLGAAAVGLLVGRLAAMIEAGVNPVLRPGDILVVRGGVSTGFAALGALAALVWTYRTQLPDAVDQLAAAALAGLAGWHGGCVWRDTCLGTTTDLPWAMTAPGSTAGRHPVEIYTAVLLVTAAWVVYRMRAHPGVASGLGLSLTGAIRLGTDPLRLSIVGGPTAWYLTAIIAGIALVGLQRLTRTRPPGPSSITIVPP